MHLILALVKPPSTRIIRDWMGRCGEKRRRGTDRELEKGEEWPWIKLWSRDVAQWAAVAVRHSAYDGCSCWKCITAAGLKRFRSLLSADGGNLPRRPKAFTIVNMHSFPPCQMLTLTYMLLVVRRQTCSHISSLSCIHPNTLTHATNPPRLLAFVFSWSLHSCSHKYICSSVTKHPWSTVCRMDFLGTV